MGTTILGAHPTGVQRGKTTDILVYGLSSGRRHLAIQQLRGTQDQLLLWAQVITGMELDAAGAVRFLDSDSWPERLQRLQELGGPPVE